MACYLSFVAASLSAPVLALFQPGLKVFYDIFQAVTLLVKRRCASTGWRRGNREIVHCVVMEYRFLSSKKWGETITWVSLDDPHPISRNWRKSLKHYYYQHVKNENGILHSWCFPRHVISLLLSVSCCTIFCLISDSRINNFIVRCFCVNHHISVVVLLSFRFGRSSLQIKAGEKNANYLQGERMWMAKWAITKNSKFLGFLAAISFKMSTRVLPK